MKTLRSLRQDIHETQDISELLEVFEELAAEKMQDIRAAILEGRHFYEGLQTLSDAVGIDLGVGESISKKHAAVFISATGGLYGDIIDRVFKEFLTHITSHACDAIVFGQSGAKLMRAIAPNRTFKYIPLSDTQITKDSWDQIDASINTYESILLFYGKFKNIAVQEEAHMRIAGTTIEEAVHAVKHIPYTYLYEPTAAAIASYVGRQLAKALVESVIHESELARHAARLISLDTAIDTTTERLGTLGKEAQKTKKMITNRKQNTRMNGMMFHTAI